MTFTEVISGLVTASGGFQGELYPLIASSEVIRPCVGSVLIIVVVIINVIFSPLFILFVT